MKYFKGIGISDAVLTGHISVFKRPEAKVLQRKITDIPNEIARFDSARKRVLSRLSELCSLPSYETENPYYQILESHMMMLKDADFNESVQSIIKTENADSEYAIMKISRRLSGMLSSSGSPLIQARASDIFDISNRLISCLSGKTVKIPDYPEKTVVCADHLLPSEVFYLRRKNMSAFVTAYGSLSSHTAIIARGMKIPAIINAGGDFPKSISDGMKIVLDTRTGDIILDPDARTEKKYYKLQAGNIRTNTHPERLRRKDSITKDGKKVNILANICGFDELDAALINNADGIGLVRSEFLFTGHEAIPSENTQFCMYKKILKKMAGKRVVIRTFDISPEKNACFLPAGISPHPREMLKTQLSALYRASAYGKLDILFPMITGVRELEEIKKLCTYVKAELNKANIRFSEDVRLGIMIETPAAAVMSGKLSHMADFFSIGTNDLAQYTYACDRNSENPELEAVLQLIGTTAENARKAGIQIGICGELAANTDLTEKFLKMGISDFSVSPSFILPFREAVRNTGLRE